jgi:carbamoyl-phosphate synthase large subunit
MSKIFVSGASGIVGYGTLKSLRQAFPDSILYGSSIYLDSIAPHFCDQFIQAPPSSDAQYIDWLIETLTKNQIDLAIPGIEADMRLWNKHRERIESFGIVLMLNNPDLIALCEDKWNFYLASSAQQIACTIPTSLASDYDEAVALHGSKLIVKPRAGFGSKDITKPKSKEEFLLVSSKIGQTHIVQPLIGEDDHEYSISAFCHPTQGVLALMGLRRKLSTDGYTQNAEVINTDPFEATIKELADHFRPIGPTNFQFRTHDQRPYLLEINPRISSATSIRTAFGYNEAMMAVNYFLQNQLPLQPTIKFGRAVRYIEDGIFYENSNHL